MTREIILVGVGSIGSFTATALAYMSRTYETRLMLFDHDTVESHNRTNQIYRACDVGMPKVIACANILKELAEEPDVISVERKVMESDALFRPTIPVVVAVDNAEARRDIFSAVRESMLCPLLIDARSGVEHGTVMMLNPSDPDHAEKYLATLPEKGYEAPVPCAVPDAIPLLFAIASVIAEFLNGYFLRGGIVQFKETLLNYSVIGPSLSTKVVKTLL